MMWICDDVTVSVDKLPGKYPAITEKKLWMVSCFSDVVGRNTRPNMKKDLDVT